MSYVLTFTLNFRSCDSSPNNLLPRVSLDRLAVKTMTPVPGSVLLELILDAQLRGHASNVASMLFGPNSCTEQILLPIAFELFFFLKLNEF